ncbi:MAG: TRAP transporter small permease [Spirochaetales bacterium]|jgi:TRAP-type C4-dicarboxylate transport system permease small subunit|nr:TRAP transporter small permease [Spirochaetales bacterium]
MLTILKKINNAICAILDTLMVILMSAMTIFIVAQVIYRYVLREPLSWSEEFSRYLFSGVTLFGAVLLYRSGGHINMSLLKDLVKIKTIQKLIDIAANILTLVFLCVVIRYGFPMSVQIFNLEVISPSMPWLNMGFVFFLLPVSAVFSLLAALEVTLGSVLRLAAREEK